MGRFDYIKYDEASQLSQQYFKHEMTVLEKAIEQLPKGRAQSLALTSLEECYMWIGKLIRDWQVQRDQAAGVKSESQEERTDS